MRRSPALLAIFVVSTMTIWGQCTDSTTLQNITDNVIRTGGNQVFSFAQSYVTGDYATTWTVYAAAQITLDGSALHSGSDTRDSGNTASVSWNDALSTTGPGTFAEADQHRFTNTCGANNYFTFNDRNLTVTTPTISGASAFWWLGSGILADHDYYAQAAWTANPNGAPGTPTWTVSTVSGGGSVSFSCTSCTNTTATSTAPSSGCVYDVVVHASYDGFNSDDFSVAIIKPSTFTLQSGYPVDAAASGGFLTTYAWALTDTCGSPDAGLDGNEQFGTWTDDYFNSTGTHNDWPTPSATNGYSPTNIWRDQIGLSYGSTPPSLAPQSPLTTVTVMHDTPWTAFIGSQTFGSGLAVYADTQQFYQDHGRHY